MSHRYNLGANAPYTWSTRLEAGSRLPKDKIIAELGGFVAQQADPLKPLSGMIIGAGAALRHTVLLGLDPSKTYGTPSPEICEQLTGALEDDMSWRRSPGSLTHSMRIFMGLRPGYDHNAPAYTGSDLRHLIDARRVDRCLTIAGDIFSIRYVPDEGVRFYDEPGVAAYTSRESLDDMLHIARTLGQARIVAETFGVDTQVYE